MTPCVRASGVARDQHHGMEVAIRKNPCGFNLAAVVNRARLSKGKVGARRNKSVQIDHRAAILPKVRMQERLTIRRSTDDLTLAIDGGNAAAWIAGDCTEIRHQPVLPEKRVMNLIARKVG